MTLYHTCLVLVEIRGEHGEHGILRNCHVDVGNSEPPSPMPCAPIPLCFWSPGAS